MIRDILRGEIEKAVKKLFNREVDFDVDSGGVHADYSSNVALKLTEDISEFFRRHGENIRYGEAYHYKGGGAIKSAKEEAEIIKKELEISLKKYVSKIEVAPAGFLNFWLSENGLEKGIRQLYEVRPRKILRGRTSKIKISLDYLDANPTGPVHLGHARSGFYGDVLSNILAFYGYKVSREFYVNNAKSSKQIQSLGKTALGKGEEYKHEQLLNILEKPTVKKKLSKMKDEKEAGFYIAGLIQKENENFLKKTAKIKFDLFFEEESVYASGKVKEIIEKLKKTGTTYKKDGALWFRSSQYGDTEDRVVIRSTGESTYLVPDIYYHLDRLKKRKNNLVINIFGADHYGYSPRLRGALKALEIQPEKIIIFTVQMARLMKGGEEFKMSKRAGVFVSLEELIKEAGLDAARFFLLMRSLDTHLDFDLNLAKERSKKNPVYYVQYAHARACSILRKSGSSAKKLDFSSPAFILKHIKVPTASPIEEKSTFSPMQGEKSEISQRALILKLIQFPEIVEDIAKDYQVHRLTTYAYELAKVFTDFYENVRVLETPTSAKGRVGAPTPKGVGESRLALVLISRKILKKSLSLLGISAPERM